MKATLNYLQKSLGIKATALPLAKSFTQTMPMYLNEIYRFHKIKLVNAEVILVGLKNGTHFSIKQTDIHLQQLRKHCQQPLVLVLENVEAYQRKRLIEKRINFIVPGTQLYVPQLFMDLRERYPQQKSIQQNDVLLPSAQFLLLYHVLHKAKKNTIEGIAFKSIAKKLAYTPMAITNAIENLKQHGLLQVMGEKEKSVKFQNERAMLWRMALKKNILASPVIKTVFVDQYPKGITLLKTGGSALPAYSNLNPTTQQHFAIEKSAFYNLQKSNRLLNLNNTEGKFALEVWKYSPSRLVERSKNNLQVVDPLSLYLSLQHSKDERVGMALEELIDHCIW